MKIMVIGGGGREHAIIRGIRQNPLAEEIYALPGNGGIAQEATCVPIAATDIEAAVAFAVKKGIDFAIVAPDDPLVLGMVDALQAAGICCFGPDKRAAEIEGSKAFAKELMRKYSIPTAHYEVFTDEDAAVAYLHEASYPLVVKADGLALGKGVVIAADFCEASEAVHAMMAEGRFGVSGRTVVIEENLTGPEVTVLAFTDGKTIVPMVSAMDHKRALDGDKGPNTGGMGVVAPNPFYTEEIAARCMREIYTPTVEAMRAEGRPFKGCLYFGLMLTADGPKVIEYNCRFGDPEAQAVLPLLQTDLLDIMLAVETERLDGIDIRFAGGHTCCLMLVSAGYPGAYETGKPVTIGFLPEGVEVFHSGTRLDEDGTLVSAGGRVLGVTARDSSLWAAIDKTYATAKYIHFDGLTCRSDIGTRALEAR